MRGLTKDIAINEAGRRSLEARRRELLAALAEVASERDIAEILGVSASTAHRQIAQAKKEKHHVP
jgi:transposase